jgi:predicted nuclease of restriction endonuclease-like (RecB) superfamily
VLGNLQQVVADSENQISQQVAAKLFSVPWGHHMLLIDKVKDDYKKAWFYVYETVENGWSRNMLLNGLGTDLYERQGHALTNFKRTLPEDTSDLAKGAQRCQEPPCPQAVSARIPASANCFNKQT